MARLQGKFKQFRDKLHSAQHVGKKDWKKLCFKSKAEESNIFYYLHFSSENSLVEIVYNFIELLMTPFMWNLCLGQNLSHSMPFSIILIFSSFPCLMYFLVIFFVSLFSLSCSSPCSPCLLVMCLHPPHHVCIAFLSLVSFVSHCLFISVAYNNTIKYNTLLLYHQS